MIFPRSPQIEAKPQRPDRYFELAEYIRMYIIQAWSSRCYLSVRAWGQSMSEKTLRSSGNVFLDLGFSREEAAILQMRADLMAKLRKVIKTRKLTQAKAAKILGVSQSRVSDLVTGKWEKFSLEMLITLATRAGLGVTVKTAA
jgi:predicted XRE-type DNA-binding protein